MEGHWPHLSGSIAYGGRLGEGLASDSPGGHAAKGGPCQHFSRFKNPPIDTTERKGTSASTGDGRTEGEERGGSAQTMAWKDRRRSFGSASLSRALQLA